MIRILTFIGKPLVILTKHHPSGGKPSLPPIGQLINRDSKLHSAQQLSDAAQTFAALNNSTYATPWHRLFSKNFQARTLAKNMAGEFNTLTEVHLKAIFSSTQHFAVYVCCMPFCHLWWLDVPLVL